eukprot:CCRYP_019313-RA/>CCRYP_019313-RA protein AED:0.45 eAED:0.47 QI:0/0/0/1/0/0/3/0/245
MCQKSSNNSNTHHHLSPNIPLSQPNLPKTDTGFHICDKFLFLGRTGSSAFLCPISAIASQSAKPTQDTTNHTLQLLDYLAAKEDTVITYHASGLIFAAHTHSRAVLAATSFRPPMQTSHLAMVPSSTLYTSSNMSWLLLPKPNLPHCSSLLVKPSTSALSHTNWATCNPPLYSKLAMSWQPKQLRPGTCTFTCYGITKANNNFAFTGSLADPTTTTIGPNTILPNITKNLTQLSHAHDCSQNAPS